MTEQSDGIIILANQNIRWGITDVIDTLIVQATGDVKEFPECRVQEIILRHNGRIVIHELFQRQIVAYLYCERIDTIVSFVGGEVQLCLMRDMVGSLTVSLHTTGECQLIGHLIMKLDEVGKLAVNQPFVEITIRDTRLDRLFRLTRFKHFFEVHRSVSLYD